MIAFFLKEVDNVFSRVIILFKIMKKKINKIK